MASQGENGEGEGTMYVSVLVYMFTVLYENVHCPPRRNFMRGGCGVGVDGEDKNRFPGSM